MDTDTAKMLTTSDQDYNPVETTTNTNLLSSEKDPNAKTTTPSQRRRRNDKVNFSFASFLSRPKKMVYSTFATNAKDSGANMCLMDEDDDYDD